MRNKKNSIIAIMVIVMLVMATGYAYFATRLSINATGSIDGSWNVYFSKIEVGTKSTGASTKGTPSVTGTTANMDVSLKAPGDYINFNITLVNAGNINAIIEDIEATAEGTPAIVFSISGIKIGDKLAGGSNASKVITIRMEYDSSVTSQPTELTKRLTVNIDAVQDIGQTITPGDVIINDVRLLSSAILDDNNIGDTFASANDNNGTSYYFKNNAENNYIYFGNLSVPVCNGSGINPDTNESINFEISSSSVSISEEECTSINEVCYHFGEYWDINSEACEDGGIYSFELTGTPTYNIIDSDPILWRLIRINGDGTIRMITDVNSTNDINPDRERRDIINNGGDLTNYANSAAKTTLENWYTVVLEAKYDNYVADSIFCNDREVDRDFTDLDGILFEEPFKTIARMDNNPTLICNRPEDRFTVDSAKGNGLLNKPVGLITADEVRLTGAEFGGFEEWNSSSSYLSYSGASETYLTMTPLAPSYMYVGSSNGGLFYDGIGFGYLEGSLIRPVINLKSNVYVTGNGTITDPYVVQYN